MANRIETTMEVVGMVHTNDNVRILVKDIETDTEYRMKIEDFLPLVMGYQWYGEWETTLRNGRYRFAKHVGWGSYPD